MVMDGTEAFEPGSTGLAAACAAIGDDAVVCSKEALAWTLRRIGWHTAANLVGLAAGLALPSVGHLWLLVAVDYCLPPR
jgi:APA family basic amino acid/polyamine antiporter